MAASGATGWICAACRRRLRSGSFGLPELLRVLAGRSVALEEVDNFLDPTIRRMMPDPNVLTDMEQAASRIADAVQHSESIAIIGDYDVDGATSTALMVRAARGGRGPVLPHSGSYVRRLWPQCRSDPQHRGARRGSAHHARLRHHQRGCARTG